MCVDTQKRSEDETQRQSTWPAYTSPWIPPQKLLQGDELGRGM